MAKEIGGLGEISWPENGVGLREMNERQCTFDISRLLEAGLEETRIDGSSSSLSEQVNEDERAHVMDRAFEKLEPTENGSTVTDALIDNQCSVDISRKYRALSLVWLDLTYSVDVSWWHKSQQFPWIRFNRQKKTVLQRQSGALKTGELVAVFGPSGAGKSTLLECLSGRRRRNQMGEVFFRAQAGREIEDMKDLKVGFIGQKDYLFSVLTVRESLLYASRLKNYKRNAKFWESSDCVTRFGPFKSSRELPNSNFHEVLVKKILRNLGLEVCADVKVGRCSGGQVKRLSIGLELISKPKILILDEPTSGLDSSSALQCVQLLKKLTLWKNEDTPLGVIASIHQPSARVLYLFEKLYILSKDGHCLYQGLASGLLAHLSQFNLRCPQFHNPSDYVIEIASGEHGMNAIENLTKVAQSQGREEAVKNNAKRYKVADVVDGMLQQNFPIILHTFLLMKRTWMSNIREPLLTWLRVAQNIFAALVGAYMYNHKVGKANGCFEDMSKAIESRNSSTPLTMDFIQKSFLEVQTSTTDNISFLFFGLLFLCFANTMATVLTFPLEISVFLKELKNAWYSTGTYYLAKTLAVIPFLIVIPFTFAIVAYVASGQIHSYMRFGMYFAVCILLSGIAEGFGILFGIIFLDNVAAAVFMACVSMFPMFYLGGFFAKYSALSNVFRPFATLSFVRYGFQAILVIMYGFERCNSNVTSVTFETHTTGPNLACLLGLGNLGSSIAEHMGDFSSANITTETLITYLGVDNTCADTLLDRFEDFKEWQHDGTKVNTTSEEDKRFLSPSYVLAHLEVSEADLVTNMVVLLVYMMVLKLIGYILLLVVTNRKLKA